MSGGNGHRGGPPELPKVRFGIDPDLTDWVLVLQGPVALVGKAGCGAAALREELKTGQAPMATLFPVYAIVTQLTMTDRGMGNIAPALVQMPLRVEYYTNVGREAKLPLHVTLTAVAFLGDLDPKSKAHVVRGLVDYEQGLTASAAGLVMPGR